MSNAINPLLYKKQPPQYFDGMNISMVFHKESKKAKLFLKNFVEGWSIVVWTGEVSDVVRDICTKNTTAVLESKNEALKLLCMYKIKFQGDIKWDEV